MWGGRGCGRMRQNEVVLMVMRVTFVGDGAEHFSENGGHGAEQPGEGYGQGCHPFFADG